MVHWPATTQTDLQSLGRIKITQTDNLVGKGEIDGQIQTNVAGLILLLVHRIAFDLTLREVHQELGILMIRLTKWKATNGKTALRTDSTDMIDKEQTATHPIAKDLGSENSQAQKGIPNPVTVWTVKVLGSIQTTPVEMLEIENLGMERLIEAIRTQDTM